MAENKYYGIYQAKVSSNADPEKRARIKVLCPDVLGATTESAWCDPCIPVAYDGGGDFCIPLINESVWVMFIKGDANRPVWLGGWFATNMSPLATNYVGIEDVRIISYADCTITMRDGTIHINIGGGNVGDLVISDGSVTVNGNLTVNGTITAKGNITAPNASITADATIGGKSFISHTHTSASEGSKSSTPN